MEKDFFGDGSRFDFPFVIVRWRLVASSETRHSITKSELEEAGPLVRSINELLERRGSY